MKLCLSVLLVLLCIVTGCTEKENTHFVLLCGVGSEPSFEEVKEGTDIITKYQSLAVFGHGHLAGDEWGELNYTDSNGDSYTYRKGGAVTWLVPDISFKEIDGRADVELVVYLLKARANKNLEPSSMILEQKWRIPTGDFKLEIK